MCLACPGLNLKEEDKRGGGRGGRGGKESEKTLKKKKPVKISEDKSDSAYTKPTSFLVI